MTEWTPYHYECCEPTCSRGGERIDERYETLWYKVEGWLTKRAQGGPNHIAQPRPQNEYRCDACMQKILSGVNVGQQTLV